ncbi:PTS system, cellobiose-specific IIA component [Streptococcus constellatus]|nr:PTS system, cellobiose-specific IIA component [Streptococcus constellatus]
MEVIVADQIIMGLILHAGDAKQHIYQALSLAKNGEFEKCNEYLELADQALLEAHNLQTEFFGTGSGGNKDRNYSFVCPLSGSFDDQYYRN